MKYKKITKDTILNTNARIRKLSNGIYINYTVTSYDSKERRYYLKSENGNIEAQAVQIMTTTQDLFDEFELLSED